MSGRGGEAPDPPLRVDWIEAAAIGDEHHGRLGLTFLPGKRGASMRYPGRVYRRDLQTDLARLTTLEVPWLLLLVEDAELARWGDPDIVDRGARHGVHIERCPIPDGLPPASLEELDTILGILREQRRRGDVAVACMGGVGRTGTIAACALVEAGWLADEAIDLVRRVRHPTAVETPQQVAFVRAFAERRNAGGQPRGESGWRLR